MIQMLKRSQKVWFFIQNNVFHSKEHQWSIMVGDYVFRWFSSDGDTEL